MKKTYNLLSIFQIVVLVAAFALQEWSVKSIGLMRYLVYLNQKWEAALPMDTLQSAAIALLFALAVSQFMNAWKQMKEKEAAAASLKKKQVHALIGQLKRKMRFLFLQMTILTLCLVFVILIYNPESYRAYYILSLALLAAALLQSIRIYIFTHDPELIVLYDGLKSKKK